MDTIERDDHNEAERFDAAALIADDYGEMEKAAGPSGRGPSAHAGLSTDEMEAK